MDAGEDDETRRPLRTAVCSYRVALGPRQEKKVMTLTMVQTKQSGSSSRCLQYNGFSLHANVRLSRYVTRPAIWNERIKFTDCDQVVYALKRRIGMARPTL